VRAEAVALGIAGALLAAIGFLPQFGGPGYEAALAAGVVLPATVAIATALLVVRRELAPPQALARGIGLGLAASALGLALALLHGLRVGICDLEEGVALFVLGPGFGAVLGGATGAFAALFAEVLVARPRHRLAAAGVLAFAAPLGGVIVSGIRFYTSPMVFAFDPYFGYFSGPLYDTIIGSLATLVTYRLGTLATLGALGTLALLLERRAPRRFTLGLRARPALAGAGLVAAFTSGALIAQGAALGHYSTSASIQDALGRRTAAGRCDVAYSSAIPESDARRTGEECDAHLRQIERFFDTRGPARVLVYLFLNDAEKGRLMGAARTYIAKPWRNEIYIQAAGYPHPVIGHELAHVVAGAFGVGPFRIAGPFNGWLPDPGRIEGVATAAAPDEDDALTQEEWAAAMLRLELLPELESLFRLGFLGQNAAQAYTASGAFIRFLHAERGAAAVRRWYGGEPLAAVAGVPLTELERRWHAQLRRLELSPAALATARARFQRPAFFQRHCPRVIDRRAADASARLGAGDVVGAREGYDEVLRLDPHDSGARLGLAACAVRRNEREEALGRYASLASAADAAPWAKLAALEGRADLLLARGDLSAARAAYDELAARLADEDRLRTLDVKKLAEQGLLHRAVVALLIGDAQGPSWDVAAPLLGERAALAPGDGLADYLIARNLFGRGRLADAARHFDRALARTIAAPRVVEEALRLRVVVACALGDRATARNALERFLALPLRTSRRQGIERFAERCGL
jgi:hypothetical protein